MELLSVNQAATILGVDDSRVRQLLRAGILEGQQVGGRWRYASPRVKPGRSCDPVPRWRRKALTRRSPWWRPTCWTFRKTALKLRWRPAEWCSRDLGMTPGHGAAIAQLSE